MPNVNPIKYSTAMTIRVDDEFKEAVDDLRTLIRPVPSKSEAVRRAVLEMRDRLSRSERKRAHVR